MKPIEIPPPIEREQLTRATSEVLVDLVLRQRGIIEQLVAEIERLKNNASSDSQSSSKPPSSDIHKRSERQAAEAERSLRLAVTKRKVCGGSRSMAGFAQTARLLSVIQTCRAQGRSVITFLKQALMVAAAQEKVSMPSLIPDSAT